MGERAAVRDSAPIREQVSFGPWVLGAMLALLVVVTLLPRDLDPASRSAFALAQSLALDGDREWAEADRGRLRERRLSSEPGDPPPEPLLAERRGRQVPDASLLHGLYLAPWSLLGPRGALLGQAFLMGVALLAAARALARVNGSVAYWLVLLMLFGSALFAYALRLWAEGFFAALSALAFAIAWGVAHPSQGEIGEIYQPPAPASWALWRWGVVGLLLGAVGGSRLYALPLLLGATALVPREHRRRGIAALLLVGLIAVGGTLLAEGAGASAGSGPAAWWEGARQGWAVAAGDPQPEPLDPRRFTAGLWGWNFAYLLAGRHVGILFFLAPVVLLIGGVGARGGRGALAASVLVASLLALWLHPFTFSGAPWSLGPAALLPLFPALWFAVARAPGRWALGVAWAWGALCLWPAWFTPLASPVAEGGKRPWSPSYLAPWAPFETTQVGLVRGREVAAGALRLVPLSPEARPAAGPGRLMFMGHRKTEVLIESPARLSAANLEVGEGGPAKIEIRGGELTETMLRPDGGVEFLVRLERPAAAHPVPGRSANTYFYRLVLRLPDGPRELLSLRIAGIAADPPGE